MQSIYIYTYTHIGYPAAAQTLIAEVLIRFERPVCRPGHTAPPPHESVMKKDEAEDGAGDGDLNDDGRALAMLFRTLSHEGLQPRLCRSVVGHRRCGRCPRSRFLAA